MRVLAFAFRAVPADAPRELWESSLTFAGLVGLEDPVRPEVPDAISACRTAGIKVIMVTGDHPQTGLAVARQIGLVQSARPRVISGDQLARLTEAQLQVALDEPEILFARVGATQKMVIVFEAGLAAAIVYTPPGNLIFGTAPLDAGAWLYMLPFALALLAFEEARKWWVRRRAALAAAALAR